MFGPRPGAGHPAPAVFWVLKLRYFRYCGLRAVPAGSEGAMADMGGVGDVHDLSRREREIAQAYAHGEGHRAIGTRLCIAPSTVRTHLGTIYRKLGVSSKIELLNRLAADEPRPRSPARRVSVAIFPFATDRGLRDGLALGLVQDIITRLARLRCVRVIARGSVFGLAERGVTAAEAARMLDIDYLATGAIQGRAGRARLSVELVDAHDARIVWTDAFDYDPRDTFAALDAIGDRIVACVASGIETAERNRSLLKHPASLDAWECFHRGLWHMFRFTAFDNDTAQALFRRAIALDPTFARAHAGLSFTHFQNAFVLRSADRAAECARALDAAGSALSADERDPAAHLAMGRALWLRGADDRATEALETSVALSPHFALGHYSLAFVQSQTGDARRAIAAAEISRGLSPFDPLLFGMLGSRAMALFRLGAADEAADCAVDAASRPNAHVHIHAIAAHCLAVAGRVDEGRAFAARIRAAVPDYGVDRFFAAFRFPPEAQVLFRAGAARIGLG